MRVFVFNILFYCLTFLAALTGLLASFGSGGRRRMRWILRAHSNFVLWLAKRILKAKIIIRGLHHIKDGPPALIVSKHQSELDVFMPLARFPDLAAIAMAELARYPLIGPVIRKLDYILVSVEGAKKNQLREVVVGSRRVHAEGRPILIYPEGELMRVGSRQRYKTGVYHIYEALGCAAQPVALSCGLVWPQREWRKRIGQTCVFEFLEPIPPGLDRETFMAEVERRIEEGTMALIREHGDPETVAIAEERSRLGLANEDDAPAEAATAADAQPAAATVERP